VVGFLENDIPRYLKLLFLGLILWGVLFSLYFLLGGYNSERSFESLPRGQVSSTDVNRQQVR